jgi:predicted PurR-regulated permease PerM
MERRNSSMVARDPNGREVQRAENGAATAWRHAADMRPVIFALVAIAVFVYLIRFILLPFVIAGVIAYICTPLLDWVAQRTRLPRALFAGLLFLLLIGMAALIIAIAGHRLIAEIGAAADDLHGTIVRLLGGATGDQSIRLFGQSLDVTDIIRSLADRIRDWFAQPDLLVLVVGYSLAGIMGMILTAALTCYFLVGGKSAARGLFWIVPPTYRPLVAQIGHRVDPLLKRYFVGVLAIVIYATIAAYIGLGVVLGIDHAVLLALLTGVLEIVPIIGSTAAAVTAGLVSLHTATGVMSLLAFALYAVLLRLSIDQVVAPLVLGGAAHVHPVLIIFCIFAGAVLFGIPGVILAVPVALTVKTTLATLYGDDEKVGPA